MVLVVELDTDIAKMKEMIETTRMKFTLSPGQSSSFVVLSSLDYYHLYWQD